jgi:hypothetical protein
MLDVNKTFNTSARTGRRGLRGVAAIPIRSAVHPPLIAVAAISLPALAAIAAFAQTPSPVTLSGLFNPCPSDLTDIPAPSDVLAMRPDAIRKLQEAAKKANRGGCYPPRATFKALIPASTRGDPLYLVTLANARAEAVAAALRSHGVDRDQFKIGAAVEGNSDNVLVTYDKFEPDDDKDAPTFKEVTWSKKEGSKVKAGDQIKVTITASERYEDGHKSWPTGVQLIQLTADDGLVDSKDYGKKPEPCATPIFTPTYTVPRNPPRIVHLTAIADDAAGNKNIKVGEFYTVEVWHGTDENSYDETSNEGVRSTYHGLVTFDLYETSKDKLEGQAHATWTSSQETLTGQCAGHKLTQDPKTVAWDAQLTGTIQHLPGSTRFDFHATPDRGPPYKVIETPGGACKLGGNSQGNDNKWSGTNFSLKSGQDHYDHFNAPPLTAGHTGQQYYKFHVESSGK